MMGNKEIKIGSIYKLVDKNNEDVYAYVRALRRIEIGFSVLDKATASPNFLDCGIFWMQEKDFLCMFKSCGKLKFN